MVYRVLVDAVVVVHLAFVAFLAVGGLMVWRWRRVIVVHVPVMLWAIAIVTLRFTCPLTTLEKHLRRLAGASSYRGDFVDHYLDGVLYPGRLTGPARLLVVALIVAGYGGLFASRRGRRHAGAGV